MKLRCVIWLFLPFGLFAQKNNVFTNTGDFAKLQIAKQTMYAGKYIKALSLFNEIAQNQPKATNVMFYQAQCHYFLKQTERAKTILLKARAETDVYPEVHLLLGKIFQGENQPDEAISEYTAYKMGVSPNEAEIQDVSVYISQCNKSKSLKANPVNVEVTNLGAEINSKYDDKAPCITADGKKLIFTTRRPATTNSPMDIEGDGGYFEDVYIANYDTTQKKYTGADEIPGSINTDAHDAATSISPDGKQVFIYKNDIKDKQSRGGDIFVSKINNNKFKTPEPMGKPINSSYWEGGACISPDGKKLFFTSERNGGFGNSDIWMVERISKKEWGKPVNLGAIINTPYDEGGIFLAPDGKTLFFCSNGPESMGSYDVFRTVYENGKWSKPVNLGFPINSEAKDGPLTIGANPRYAYMASERSGGLGGSDLYMVDLKDYALLEIDFKAKVSDGLSIVRGVVRDGYEGYGIPDAEVELTDLNGKVVGSVISGENGDYFFTVAGGSNYTITIKKKGFKTITETLEVKKSEKETYTLEKHFLLKK